MKTLVVVVLAAALAVVAGGPAPEPAPEPAPATPGVSAGPVGPPTPLVAVDQESQASEAVSKRGAARLSPVSGNSIVDNTLSNAPPQQQQQQQQQLQAPVSYSIQQQQPLQQQQQQQQPLYAPHPYSFAAPQQHFFQYQPALPALPPLAMLHSKYQGPGKQHVLQYVSQPQPYYQVPQFQAPLMYIIPQPHASQSHAQAHQAPGSQAAGQQATGQTEQAAQPQPQHQPQQPHYVMLVQAPAPVAAPGFQYYNHPQLALQQQQQQPQQLITFYAGPQHQLQHHQLQQHQLQQHQLQQHQLQQHQHHQLQQSRFYPEQQQLVYQSPPESQSEVRDVPHFVPKQSAQNPVGLEAPAPPTPASLVGSYGARVQQQHPHAYKTIIKA